MIKSCIVFYGIGRNVNLHREILFYRRAFDNPSFVYFLHRENFLDNPRSEETGSLDYSFINDLDIPIVPVDMDNLGSYTDILNRSIDPHNDGRKSLNNLLKQLLMLSQIPSYLIHLESCEYFLVIRDDVKFSFFSKLILLLFPPIITKNCQLFVSAFSWHYGVNDKFFIAGRRVMTITCNRLSKIEEFIDNSGYLNAERLLHYIIVLNKFEIVPLFVNVGRVRINGSTKWDKFIPAFTRLNDIYRVLRYRGKIGRKAESG